MVGKARSCCACRQAKVACDARSKAPNPCSRCDEKKLSCRFDKNFKRIATRQLARDIANGARIVREPLNRPEEVITFADDPGLLDSRTERRGALLLSLRAETYPDFQLDDVLVSSDTIVDLFQHFERYYLPHAPFMQPVGPLDRLASASPLLFWTIALITCQHHEKHHELYSRLLAPHQELMLPLSTRAIRSIGEIHALLLLCIWPLPKRQAMLDPIWNYVGIAVNTCMKMNFHNPLPPGHAAQGFSLLPGFSGDITPQTQGLTWMAILQGFLPHLSSSHHLRYVRKALERLGPLVPPEFQASILMSEIVCNYSASLEEVDDIAVHFSLVQAFDSSLDAIRQTYSAQWTPELDIQLQSSKLNLYAMTALLPPREAAEMEVQDSVNMQYILHRGLESSSRILSQMKKFSLLPFENGMSGAGRLISYPRRYCGRSDKIPISLLFRQIKFKPPEFILLYKTRSLPQQKFIFKPWISSQYRSIRHSDKTQERASGRG
ncbi:hypothetical protein DL771_000777 [Monosporascus sp. 5C6A]|nr:hypothetical protein DL771_000777 [Monosporascus sp. 5C6A]